MAEVARGLRPELEPSPGRGVDETQDSRMECEPPGRDGVGGRIAIDGVPQHSVAQVGEVHPNLVGAPCPQLRLHERGPREPLQWTHGGPSRAPAGPRRQGGAAGRRARAADPARDKHLAFQVPAHERDVATLHRVGAELALQLLRGRVGEGQHHHARGVPVETVHDQDASVMAGAPLQLGRSAGEHGVLVALGRRVDQQARRLVHHQHVGILVQYLDRRRLRCASAPREVGVVLDHVALSHECTRIRDHHPVHQHVADKHLALGAGVRGGQQLLCRPAYPARALLHRARVAPKRCGVWTAPRFPG